MRIRRQFIVNKKFQYSFLSKNILFFILCFIIIFLGVKIWEKTQTNQGFLLRLPSNEQVIQWAEKNDVNPHSVEFVSEFIKQADEYTFFDLLAKPLFILIIINLILLILFNIYYSNKIAGPLYRLKREIDKKINGDPVSHIKLRKNDEFQELADSINKLLGTEKIDK